MARKSRKRGNQIGSIVFEIGGVKLILDGKGNKITLSAPTIVLDSPNVLMNERTGKRALVKKRSLTAHAHMVTGVGRLTGIAG